jgi:putative transcriptional regulator
MRIKSNLSTLMGQRRLSIKDVHEQTGLARGTISNLYNDRASRIDYDTIAKLCEAFGCGIESLLIIEKENEIGGQSNVQM